MNYNRLSRIFTSFNKDDQDIDLAEHQSHYLINVMRRRVGDLLIIFNGRDGEYLARISAISKKKVSLKLEKKLRDQMPEGQLILIFALIKNPRLNYLIEKATEMGVTEFIPVITHHSVRDKLNMDKIKSWIIEAAEQSERLSVPSAIEPIKLVELIKNWDPEIEIIFANESDSAHSIASLSGQLNQDKKYAILIGPEGGFSSEEKKLLAGLEFVKSVHLGPRILRAETAAICAISCMQLLLNNLSLRNR